MLQPHPKNFTEGNKTGNFFTWPGLNNQQLLDNIATSIETVFGNMEQEIKNPQSTKQVKSELELEEDRGLYPYI